ncbi:MAG: acyl--CoA ligase, partial [Phycisphaerales bacterium]
MKLIDLFADSAAAQPRRIAVKSADFEICYGDALADVYVLRDWLRSAGCAGGVKVAIVLKNSAEYLIGFFAVSAAGGAILPLSARMTAYEAAGRIESADASIVITSEAYGRRLSEALGPATGVTLICVRYDADKKLRIQTAGSGECKVDAANADVALMVPTSGTTGAPKMVMLTDHNLISNMTTYRSVLGLGEHKVACCVLSLHHIYCICAQVLTHMSQGDTFVIGAEPFFIKDFLKAVQAYSVNIAAFVPYMAILLAEYPRPEEFNLESLKYVTLSGAKTPTQTYELLVSKYRHVQFINTYGMSEAGSRISLGAPCPAFFPPDSVGRPIPGVEVRIVDEHGEDVPAGRPGEILVKSSGVMKGYYKQRDLTAETVVDGWLKTADLGKLDRNGNLFILGRIKDIIITGGQNVSPLEIEECLTTHPGIREAAVVGQKHRLLQEAPCAFVVKSDASEDLRPIDIIEHCKG